MNCQVDLFARNVETMPMDKDELQKVSSTRKGSRKIGSDDPLLQEVVSMINDFPARVTLTGIAETMQMQGKHMDTKLNNLRTQIKRRLDILCDMTHRETGQPGLKRRSELVVDAYGETDGRIRHIWYLPAHEGDVVGVRMSIDEFRLLLDIEEAVVQQLFDAWKPDVSISLDLQGWKIEFWSYVRKQLKDTLWSQYYAAELGVEQDMIMQKRLLRRLSVIIDSTWEALE